MCKKISVIIPCYNAEKYIDRCLTSLVNQTIGLENLAVICVNDASTDRTWNKLNGWKARYPQHFTLINCAHNGRQGTARNLGLSHVTTPYTAYVDSDDWIEPDMYEKMYEKAASHHCEIVFCGSIRDSSEMMCRTQCPDAPSWLLSINSPDERRKFIVNNTIKNNCWDKLIQTDFLIDHQILFPEKLAYEDIYWSSMLYLYAETVCIMEEKFYHYYVNENSTVLALNQPYHKDIFQINTLKWDMYQTRNFLNEYYDELAFDYLITGYFSALKILALRYTTDTWQDYLNLRGSILARIPDFAENPYLCLLTDFQRLQLQLLSAPLSRDEWHDYCSLIQSHPNMN